MHIQLSSFQKQIVGAAIGIVVASLLYVSITELSYLRGDVTANVPVPLQSDDQAERIARIAVKAQEALAENPRRLPPHVPVHTGAPPQGVPEDSVPPAPLEPIETHVQSPVVTERPGDLPASGVPLALLTLTATSVAALRTSLRRRSRVS